MPVGELNAFGITQYDNNTSFFGGRPVMSQAYGYGIVVGFGIFFSLFTSLIVFLDYRFGGTRTSSEQFNCAGRTIKTGLIAVDIVSHWTWAATLLQSSNVAWQYGVSGPFWYASGATVQIILFGILAVEVKRKAPKAHTILEIVRARWGTAAHITFLFFTFLTNIIVTGMLLLGGSAVIHALTGMNIYAAAFLIPFGIIMYTALGGLKATFMSCYIHTVYIYVVLCLFTIIVYATSPDLGSPGKVWENLSALAKVNPVPDNLDGEYLTMFSKGGLIFGIINLVGNFGTVFVDQAYWQSAIAARPSASHKGYILGGILWFCIPFTLATCLGLASRALDLPLTAAEAGEGLVPPAAATYLLGKAGAILIILMLFMAVTSSGSAELIAVSSLFTYDIYRTYIKPDATPKETITVSRISVFVFGLLMGILAVLLNVAKVSLGWVYLAMGVLIGSAVFPIAACLLWSKCTKYGAIAGAFIGQWAGLIFWLTWAKVGYGEVNLTTTGYNYPMLAGNLASILISTFVCVIVSLIRPDNFNWDATRNLKMVEEEFSGITEEGVDSAAAMDNAYKWILIWGSALAVTLFILWPLLALPARVFSKGYFTFWVVISMTWGFAATIISTLLPIWEARKHLWMTIRNTLTGNVPASADLSKHAGDFFGDKADHPSKHGNPYLVEEEQLKRKQEELEKATLPNKV
jgi:SSS family transporter